MEKLFQQTLIKTGLISTSIFGVLAFILVEGYVLFKYKYNILKNFTYPINLLYDFKLLSSDIRSSRFLDKTIRGHSNWTSPHEKRQKPYLKVVVAIFVLPITGYNLSEDYMKWVWENCTYVV